MSTIRFEKETDIEKAKADRQAEWEKVRKADDPLSAPENPLSNKSLYDQLKVQKDQKQLEDEEAKKFKNHWRGLHEEEVVFLEQASTVTIQRQKQMEIELKSLVEANKNVVIESLSEPIQVLPTTFSNFKLANLNSKSKPKQNPLNSLVRKRASADNKTKAVSSVGAKITKLSDQISTEVKSSRITTEQNHVDTLTQSNNISTGLVIADYEDSSEEDEAHLPGETGVTGSSV